MSGRISPTTEILGSLVFTDFGKAECAAYLKGIVRVANNVIAQCQKLKDDLEEPIGNRIEYPSIGKTFQYEAVPASNSKIEKARIDFSELTLAPREKKTFSRIAKPNLKDVADQQIRQEMTEAAVALAAIRRIGDSAQHLFGESMKAAVKTGSIFGPAGRAVAFGVKLLRAVNQESDKYLIAAEKVARVVGEKTRDQLTPDFVKAIPERAKKTGVALQENFGLDPKIGAQTFEDATVVAADAALGFAGAGIGRAFKAVTPKVTRAANTTISKQKAPVFTDARESPLIKRANGHSSLIRPEEILIVPKGPIIARVRNPLRDSIYFHATDLDGLFGILHSKSINRSARNDGFYVGTAPNLQFGNFVILLNEKAAKGNTVGYTAPIKDNIEIGFVHPIAATEETIEAIAVLDGIDREVLASRVANIAKRRIPIISLDKVKKELWKRKNP